MAQGQRDKGIQPLLEDEQSRDGFSVLELLIIIAIIAILIFLLLPMVSFSALQPLADGVVLHRGTPLEDVAIYIRPVLADGSFGDQAYCRMVPTAGVGRFEAITTKAWRQRNSTTGEFVVNLRFDPALLTDSDEERQLLEACLKPETSPLRIQIPEDGAHELQIELASLLENSDTETASSP